MSQCSFFCHCYLTHFCIILLSLPPSPLSLLLVPSLSAASIRSLCDSGSSHHAFRFQSTGDLRDMDTLQTALTNSTDCWETTAAITHTSSPSASLLLLHQSCTCMSVRVEMDVMFSSDVIGRTREIIEMLHTTCTAAPSARECV